MPGFDAPPGTAQTGRKVALLVGINKYRNGIRELRNAISDVDLIADVLYRKHGYEIEKLTAEQTTGDGIRKRLAALSSELAEDDRLIFYFAGHGVAEELQEGKDGPQGYFLPLDARRDDPDSFLPMSDVRKALAGLRCRHLLLLLDCCFAGAFRWEQNQTRNVYTRPAKLYAEQYDRYLRDIAWQVITSAAEDETALDMVASGGLGKRGEGPRHTDNSPFAKALHQALEGAADFSMGGHPADGVMLAGEIHLYLNQEFTRLEAEARIKQPGRTLQTPLLWSIGKYQKGQFIFLTSEKNPDLPRALELTEANNPYRGLNPYEKIHAELFFGRDELAEALCQQVSEQRLVVVSDVSGSGKSSLVGAGLLSRLGRKDNTWQLLSPLRPGSKPLAALATLAGELEVPDVSPFDFESAVAALGLRHPANKILLFVDQLEELLTMSASPEERQKFLQCITRAIDTAAGKLHVVMTLRSDYEPQFKALLQLKQGGPSWFRVPPLSRQQLCEVIERPATERVLEFSPPKLVDTLADEVAAMPGALPLLSFTLSQMYRAYVKSQPKDRRLTEADYAALGKVAGALNKRADEIFTGFGEGKDRSLQSTLRRVMLRMVSREVGNGSRRRVPLAELEYSGPEQERVDTVVSKLTEAHLLVVGNDSLGMPYVEPAHDKLVSEWPRLREFIDQEKETLPLQARLTAAALDWQSSGRKQHLWNDNPRLAQVVTLLRQDALLFNALESEFIQQSEALRRRQRFIKWSLVTGVTAVLFSITIAALVARDHAEQRDLDMVVENARQLLLEKGQPIDALLRLNQARERGSRSSILLDLLREAARPLDALQLVIKHEGINSASFSPDGNSIVTSSNDKTARVWDSHSGQPLKVLSGHKSQVYSASYRPDGNVIITKSWDITRTTALWDAHSGQWLEGAKATDQEEQRHGESYSPDGRRVVNATRNDTVVYDIEGSPLFVLRPSHRDNVTSQSFSPDGQRIVTSSEDGTAQVWDAYDGRHIHTLHGHSASVNSAAFSPDGTRIVTASADKTARVWNAKTGQLLLTLYGHVDRVVSASFSPDGSRIVTASRDSARVYDARSSQLGATLRAYPNATARVFRAGASFISAQAVEEERIPYASYSADGRRIVIATDPVRIFEATSGQQLATLPEETRRSYCHAGSHIVNTSYRQPAQVFSADGGKLLTSLVYEDQLSVDFIICSPDGSQIAIFNSDKTARIYDAMTGKLLFNLPGQTNKVQAADYSNDGSCIVTLSNGIVQIFSAHGGGLLTALPKQAHPFTSVRYTTDGSRLVTAAGPDVQVFSADSGKLLITLNGYASNDMLVSPDGSRIVTIGGGTARVFSAHSGRLLTILQGQVDRASFSPDGSRIVTTNGDKIARIFDAVSGQVVTHLQGHADIVASAMYSPDGKHILTISEDKTAQIWNVAPDRRSVAEVQKLIDCRSAIKMNGDFIVPTPVAADSCRSLLPAAPQLGNWDQQADPLWAAILALETDQLVAAKTVLAQARRQIEPFQDPAYLAVLTLTEAALSASALAPAPAAVADLVNKVPRGEQALLWGSIEVLAHESLHRPRWALWAMNELRRVLASDPNRNGSKEEERAINNALQNSPEYRLAAGSLDEVLQQTSELFAANRATYVDAALAWLAAIQQKDKQVERTWAQRTFDSYSHAEGGEIFVRFGGTRFIFSKHPDSHVSSQALSLMDLLEQKKSPETSRRLATLFGFSPSTGTVTALPR